MTSGINWDRIQNSGEHAQTLDFSKAQAVTAGQRLDFGKDNPDVKNIRVELYWNSDNDGDVSILLLGSDDKALPGRVDPNNPNSTAGMVWYNNEEVPGVIHSGDVTTAGTDPSEPEETIRIQLDRLDSKAEKVLVVASTFPDEDDATERPVPFGKLRDCKVMVIDDDTSKVLYLFELSEDYDAFTSVELANFYKRNGEWRFTSMGTGVGTSPRALSDIAAKYGVK